MAASPETAESELESFDFPPSLVRIAASPFDKTGADIVLLSSDKVAFHVYKAVLILASSFFEDMFSLKQPPTPMSDEGSVEPPVIDVTEDSETLDALLRICYPIDDPKIDTLDHLDKVLVAALKYDIPIAIKMLRRKLQKSISASPLEVFAIACTHLLEDEARRAAEHWKTVMRVSDDANSTDFGLTVPGMTFSPRMRDVSAGAYYRLLVYLRTGTLSTKFCTPSPAPPADVPSPFKMTSSDVYYIASAPGVFGITAFSVDVSANVLEELLQLCYPLGVVQPHRNLPSPRFYSQVVSTALRYNMHAVVRTIRRNMSEVAREQPLTIFLIAARFGWTAEAQTAAEYLANESLDDMYSGELEVCLAGLYHELLRYQHTCHVATLKIYREFESETGHYRYSVADGGWKRAWFNPITRMPSSSVRMIPSVIAELHAEKRGRGGTFDVKNISETTRVLEAKVKEALRYSLMMQHPNETSISILKKYCHVWRAGHSLYTMEAHHTVGFVEKGKSSELFCAESTMWAAL
ncbi:hypothetical protein NM688_g208 [Phlebia brevispora]|uniref:Uncharacterized protein n=1 Tax=Phlebia brevispora TaxID=194682 RepID=A0ACC1TF62_9APHY|nr:hypothetical protein NM688_g208 [Phlebia brevispora]